MPVESMVGEKERESGERRDEVAGNCGHLEAVDGLLLLPLRPKRGQGCQVPRHHQQQQDAEEQAEGAEVLHDALAEVNEKMTPVEQSRMPAAYRLQRCPDRLFLRRYNSDQSEPQPCQCNMAVIYLLFISFGFDYSRTFLIYMWNRVGSYTTLLTSNNCSCTNLALPSRE